MNLVNSSLHNDQITSCQSNDKYNKSYRYICVTASIETFKIVSTTLLSLLLPLSFLLLARITTAHYLLSVIADNFTSTPPPTSFLTSLFLHTKIPTIVYLLMSLITSSSFIHALTNTSTITFLPDLLIRHRLTSAWTVLTVVQLSVGLGIEGSIAIGIDGSGFGQDINLISKVLFVLGLHETTLFWWRAVVKPVVDDTMYGGSRAEGWMEKVAIGVVYAGLWWDRLREEVLALVVVPELKRELMMGIGVADFVGWWLFYLTVAIGIVRVNKGLMRMVEILRRGRVVLEEESPLNDDKV